MDGLDCQITREDIVLNLKQGLDAEYKALEGYRDLIKLITDKVDRNKLEMVIADEEKHIKIVERLIALVTGRG